METRASKRTREDEGANSAPDSAPTQVDDSTAPHSASTDPNLCPSCSSVDLGNNGVSFAFHCSKNCCVCALCFARAEQKRNCSPTYDCPCCLQDDVPSYTIKYTNATTNEVESEDSRPLAPDPMLDPVRDHEKSVKAAPEGLHN
jgi:hypothetical protein